MVASRAQRYPFCRGFIGIQSLKRSKSNLFLEFIDYLNLLPGGWGHCIITTEF